VSLTSSASANLSSSKLTFFSYSPSFSLAANSSSLFFFLRFSMSLESLFLYSLYYSSCSFLWFMYFYSSSLIFIWASSLPITDSRLWFYKLLSIDSWAYRCSSNFFFSSSSW
jgi:hypothetical protein